MSEIQEPKKQYVKLVALKNGPFSVHDGYTVGKRYEVLPAKPYSADEEDFWIVNDEGSKIPCWFEDDVDCVWELENTDGE